MGNEAEELAGKRSLVHIPSHAEVLENSRPQPPPSFFRASPTTTTQSVSNSSATGPSVSNSQQRTAQQSERVAGTNEPSSFTEAFSYLRKTDFYTPPPAPIPPPAPPSGGSFGSGLASKQQEVPLPALTGQARNAIVVSRRQKGNPVLKYIRNLRWVYGEIVPDYMLGQTTCALYLSLRYHLLHPDYLYFRIRELQKSFRLRVVLCHIDVEDVIKPLHEVTKTALLHDCSLLCAWSLEECARYLETIKMYENKPADNIQERTDNDYLSRLTSALTTVRHVNKTDVVTLGSSFGTLAAVVGASMEELARCPGIGERKVKRLHDAFHEPFRRTTKQLRLSNIEITTNQDASGDANTPVDFSEGASADGSANAGVSKAHSVEPEVSVRRALDAAYAKAVECKVGNLDETCRERSNTDSTKTHATDIEIIELT